MLVFEKTLMGHTAIPVLILINKSSYLLSDSETGAGNYTIRSDIHEDPKTSF